LRERTGDIALLEEHFLRRFEPRAMQLTAETLGYLELLPWFGNVRELRNALEHAAILARGGHILPEHFPTLPNSPPGPMTGEEQLAESVRNWLAEIMKDAGKGTPQDVYESFLKSVEVPLFAEVMRRAQGNRWQAAKWLGLNRATVRRKLGLYNLAGDGADEMPEPGETGA
jgi:two-component system nitrogen regulation response regulator GlnG